MNDLADTLVVLGLRKFFRLLLYSSEALGVRVVTLFTPRQCLDINFRLNFWANFRPNFQLNFGVRVDVEKVEAGRHRAFCWALFLRSSVVLILLNSAFDPLGYVAPNKMVCKKDKPT
tara:strand:- start:174 stop:524 length:351 start_codon:yes stop_codon:yes gene_type:complete